MNVIQEAKTEKAQEIALNMLKEGMSVELIAKLSELPEKEILAIKNSLKQ